MAHQNIYIFSLGAHGKGISGSDRIFIEFARHWSKNFLVKIYLWEEGYQMCQRQQLVFSNVKFIISKMNPWKKFGFFINYFARIIEGIKIGFSLKLENTQSTIIYSSSEFWMDSLPSFILKLRFPKIKWIAAWYQSAPNPFVGFSEGKRSSRYRLSALIYWLIQFPIKPIINNFANFVLVNNDNEKKKFSKLNKKSKVLVVLGAVDFEEIKKWKEKFKKEPKIYDAVFQGRFHPQKGVIELIDIWEKVVQRKNDAKLVMIGDGPLMSNIKLKVKSAKMANNIILKGYLFDGEEKYKIFSQSRVVVHPSFYDSGGMSALEAMAFGLPVVGFNLKSYKHYYSKGMIKVRIGDISAFATAILQLLSDKKLYKKIKNDAEKLVSKEFSWEYRSRQILARMLE